MSEAAIKKGALRFGTAQGGKRYLRFQGHGGFWEDWRLEDDEVDQVLEAWGEPKDGKRKTEGQVLYDYMRDSGMLDPSRPVWGELNDAQRGAWDGAAGAVLDAACDWDGG